MFRIIFYLLFLILARVEAQAGDGIPDPDRNNPFEINVCYTNDNGQLVSEPAVLPNIILDFDPTQYVAASPTDPSRNVLNLPTYALARYHWWVFSIALLQTQKNIADCVGRIRQIQELVGYMPVIDSVFSPYLSTVHAYRDYLIPMDALQRADQDYSRPPTREDAIAHVVAAIVGINERVYYLGLCESEALTAKNLVAQKLQEGEAAKAELAILKKKKKK